MRLIIGLGNPDKKYEKTRHNVGFMVIDKFAEKENYLPWRLAGQFKAKITQKGNLSDRTILAKPQTYMNLSGETVRKIMDYYKFGSDDLIVISDDIDLPLGTIRVRAEGSSGGHKGLESIIDHLKDNRFIRLKIGIGSPIVSSAQAKIPSERYVLQKFTPSEGRILTKVLDQAVGNLLRYLKEGFEEETIVIKT